MYITLAELAEYLDLPVEYINAQHLKGHIKAIHTGTEYVVSMNDFSWYKEQLEQKRKQYVEELHEPIPDDWDAKDED